MTKGNPTNIAASVHARLMNLARAEGRSFNDLLQFYAMERFLYRLSRSDHAAKFILKGALLLRVWDPGAYRTTRDIDLLGRMASDVDAVAAAIASVCRERVAADGLEFDAASVRGERIVEDAEYEGVRVTFPGRLGNARVTMQIDVGFGDAVTPAPKQVAYPVLLDMPAPRLRAYPPETVIAEKFEVMLKRGDANSRMKDFHDVWWVAQHREFDGAVLAKAIRSTCAKRGTEILARPTALSKAFAESSAKAAQWRAFRRRLNPTSCPEGFAEVMAAVREFLQVIAAAIAAGEPFERTWTPPGPWR
ncbi:MAG: nucleotidyl transferase AbiEii/AbiGii toxin family protein [Phycisphaerales bacterium]|nr:nucleotidyl transferase AbiEii/AbiGii toxin family protein [Phycisphaerales bacterium]